MRFIAEYSHNTGSEKNYFRTVWGDTINEATKMAERFCRKNFTVLRTTQQFNGID